MPLSSPRGFLGVDDCEGSTGGGEGGRDDATWIAPRLSGLPVPWVRCDAVEMGEPVGSVVAGLGLRQQLGDMIRHCPDKDMAFLLGNAPVGFRPWSGI